MSRFLSFVWTASLLALSALRQRPVRSALTAFGILVGIAAVTIVVALAEGAGVAVSGAIDTLGTNAILVQPQPSSKSGVRDEDKPSELDESDVHALPIDVPEVEKASPILTVPEQVVVGAANAATKVVGTSREFFDIRNWSLARGTVWTKPAEASRERVCLIGETVHSELFGPEDPIGRSLRIGRFPFRIIGVLARKGESAFGGDQDDIVVMPISTLRSKLLRTRPGQVHRILLSARTEGEVERASRRVADVLRQRHHLVEGAPDDFLIHTQEEFRRTQQDVLGVLQALLLGIGAVSLVVGGIGVMNIMLVSVAERTREIGIRMAIGARARDIAAQFLIEAVVLTLLGGILGTVVATASVFALRGVLDLPMRVSAAALGIALATSTGIGLTFGFFPAKRASALDPIDALRTE